jgi:rhodanese-related sulfurtransferase
VTPDITVAVVAARLAAGDAITLLDVREPWEYERAHLPNATLIPLATMTSAVSSLDPALEYVVYCHHGMRSAMAANWLVSQGFAHVSNMTGGIDAWSLGIDPAVAQY